MKGRKGRYSKESLFCPQGLVLANQFLFFCQTQLFHLPDHGPFSFSDVPSFLLQQLDFPLHSSPPLDGPHFVLVVHVPVCLVTGQLVLEMVFELTDGFPLLRMFFLHLVHVLPELPLNILVLFADVLDVINLVISQSFPHQLGQFLILASQSLHLFLVALLKLLACGLLDLTDELAHWIPFGRKREHRFGVDGLQPFLAAGQRNGFFYNMLDLQLLLLSQAKGDVFNRHHGAQLVLHCLQNHSCDGKIQLGRVRVGYQVVVDLESFIFVEDVGEAYQQNGLDDGAERVIETINFFLQFRKVPAQETHDAFGRVRVVVEDGPKPVQEEGQGGFESCNCIFLEQLHEGVNEPWQPLVSQVWVEPTQGRDDEGHLFVHSVFRQEGVRFAQLDEVVVVQGELQELNIDGFSGLFWEEVEFPQESLMLFESSLIFCDGPLLHIQKLTITSTQLYPIPHSRMPIPGLQSNYGKQQSF